MAQAGIDSQGKLAVLASPSDDPRTVTLLLGVLFTVAAALGAFTVLLPHPAAFDDPALLGNCAVAAVAGIAIVALAGRLPTWSLPICVAFGTLAITRAIYYSHEGSAYYSL